MTRNKLTVNITFDALTHLLKLDESFINTENYMGITYFWAYEYRHLLRDNKAKWIKVHEALRNAGLDVTGESEKHEDIIKNVLGMK